VNEFGEHVAEQRGWAAHSPIMNNAISISAAFNLSPFERKYSLLISTTQMSLS